MALLVALGLLAGCSNTPTASNGTASGSTSAGSTTARTTSASTGSSTTTTASSTATTGASTTATGASTTTTGSSTATTGSSTAATGASTATTGASTATTGASTATTGSTGGSGALTLSLSLDKLTVSPGDTITGTLTLTNSGTAAVSVQTIIIAGRPPGGTHGGGPYDDFAPAGTATTIAPGASLAITATRTFTLADPLGSWESYGTWRDTSGTWHDGPSTFFTVSAPAPQDAGPGSPDGGLTPPMAPNGYYVQGNTIYDASGTPHLLHGVDRPTLESDAAGYMLSANDYQLMATWKAHIVRIALNQDFWLSGAAMYNPNFAATVDQQVQWAHAAGLDVILDLHCSDKGDLANTTPSQQLMADQNSLRFWQEVATKYKNDGRVLFELYNEPHDITWDIWQSGGVTTEGWTAVGMQQLYDTVRATGAENVVLIGGNSWSSDLSGVPTHRIVGHNIVYAAHPYDWPGDRTPNDWQTLWGNLAATDPVILTEFGDSPQTAPACSTSYYSNVIAYADAHNVSWTSWAWMVWNDPCLYPTILADWNGTPNAMGTVVKQALQSYP